MPIEKRRILLHFPDLAPQAARKALDEARLELRKPDVLWIQAEDYDKCVGTMTTASRFREKQAGPSGPASATPRRGDMSFGLVRPGEDVTLSGKQVLGNCGVNHKRWHWTGRGGGVTTVPPGSPIVFGLEPGPFVFRIYPREGSEKAATNPRLDCICLSEAADYVPTDGRYPKSRIRQGLSQVETSGLEPPTPGLQSRCSPN